MNKNVLIVGGGLAGLNIARLLHQAGISLLLLEARHRLGGRILSVDAAGQPSNDGFDLGASWFWPAMQPGMGKLVHDLGLSTFAQSSDGDLVFQRASREAPRRYPAMRQEPPSMRLSGGNGALISTLASGMPKECIRIGARVTHVALDGQGAEVSVVDAEGIEGKVQASHVVFALPPRLVEATITFMPKLAPDIAHLWRGAPTWMAPHAKFFALYDRPFWWDAGLSGTAQSMVGPLVEIHDATTASGKAGLFGFIGIPAEQRAAVGDGAIVAASIEQLGVLFGPQATTPLATLLKDWAADPLTATPDDKLAGEHPVPTRRAWVGGEWSNHISLAGSETSDSEPGYLAGAVNASERAAADIVKRFRNTHADIRSVEN